MTVYVPEESGHKVHAPGARVEKRKPGTMKGMTSAFSELIIDCTDMELLARFWCEVLGYSIVVREDDWVEISGPEGPSLIFVEVPETKTIKNRVHIDLNPVDRDRDAEVSRLVELGATHADVGQGDVDWVVLADPEGNEFCLLASRVDDVIADDEKASESRFLR
jgi:hypothetical protein